LAEQHGLFGSLGGVGVLGNEIGHATNLKLERLGRDLRGEASFRVSSRKHPDLSGGKKNSDNFLWGGSAMQFWRGGVFTWLQRYWGETILRKGEHRCALFYVKTVSAVPREAARGQCVVTPSLSPLVGTKKDAISQQTARWKKVKVKVS